MLLTDLAKQPLHRYPNVREIASNLSPLDDAVALIRAFASAEYLSDVLIRTRSLSEAAATTRVRSVVPHVRTALDLLDQAFAGPPDVAFLPLYYALLNLAKVYILLGPHHAELPQNRWHGATYDGHAKDSHGLLTEEIVLKRRGAIPLFYQTITGTSISRELRVQMADVYPYVRDVSAEYYLASGEHCRVEPIAMGIENVGGEFRAVVAMRPTVAVKSTEIKLLVGFKKDTARPNTFVAKGLSATSTDFQGITEKVRRFLLYLGRHNYFTPISSRRLLLPEEFPILLALFHMSNVVRYKPEFLARLRDSRFWPMLTTAQRHCVLKFLVLTWSYVHQETLSLVHA